MTDAVEIAGGDVPSDLADAAVSTVDNVYRAKVMRFKAWRGLSESYRDAAEAARLGTPTSGVQPLSSLRMSHRAPRWCGYAAVLDKEGIPALAFVPVVAARQLLGNFVLYCGSPHAFTRRELDLAGTIAGTVGGQSSGRS